jgi:hypothetical protein
MSNTLPNDSKAHILGLHTRQALTLKVATNRRGDKVYMDQHQCALS